MYQIHKGFSRRDFKSRREADFRGALEVREQHGWRPRATWLSDGGLGLVKLMDGDNLWHMEWGNGQDKDTVARSHFRSLGVFSTYLTANKRSQVNFLFLGLFLFFPQYFADATQWTSISPQQTKKVRFIKGRWDKRGRGNLWSDGRTLSVLIFWEFMRNKTNPFTSSFQMEIVTAADTTAFLSLLQNKWLKVPVNNTSEENYSTFLMERWQSL